MHDYAYRLRESILSIAIPYYFQVKEQNMNQIEPLIPLLLGGCLGLFALIGMLEFIKESSMAFRKS
tara:strand:+ start:150 stop:347 length:198 start_codon:yes stop_codon:yes gene_type:complete